MLKYLGILLVVAGCGSFPNSLMQEGEAPNKTETLFVVLGGFNSCPDKCLLDTLTQAGKTAQMVELVEKKILTKHAGSPVTLFTACYTGPDDLIVHDRLEKISGRYAWGDTSLSSTTKGVSSFEIPQGESLSSTEFLKPLRDALSSYLDEKDKQGVEVSMYVFGHSYGGFTGIHLADRFSKNLVSLATIDPISMIQCQASTMVKDIYGTITRGHKGCQQAPSDPDSAQSISQLKKFFKESTDEKWWINFYQDSFPFLQSGAIVGLPSSAPKNIKVQRSAFKTIFNGDYHSQTARHGGVWTRIAEQF